MSDGQLRLDLGDWAGPLDLLLDLARRQKVDLAQLSIGRLVDQYLAHVAAMAPLNLELAADYLVMAAWLVDLKSRLLLPVEAEPEPEPVAEAARLRHRLVRLAAMRDVAQRLAARPRLGRDTHARARPEGLATRSRACPPASLGLLLAAYGAVAGRFERGQHRLRRRPVVTLDAALVHLRGAIAGSPAWLDLGRLTPAIAGTPALNRSAAASALAASLELVRLGAAELRQSHAFAPIGLRRR